MENKRNLENIYFRIIEYGTYLALFVPLIFSRNYFFPFVVPKTVFFRIVVDIIFIAYILLAISKPQYRPRINLLTTAIAVFLGVLLLTSVTGINFERSFWSVFERMTGLLTFFHLFVFYIILTSVFKERRYWERILSVSILVCVFISFLVLTSGDPIIRSGGTLGNPSFFSAYLLFNIFFAIILLVMKPGFWRIFYGTALIIFLFALFFNPGAFTKGAVSAFAVGMFILIFGSLIFYLFSSGNKKLRNTAFLLVILLLLGALVFFQLDFAKEKMAEVWQSGSVQSRLIVWHMGWQAWQERFLLGWGLENFNVPFAKYYDPELPFTGDIWYDRVHNIVLDTGVASGILGLLSYLSIFGIAIFGLLKLLPRIVDRKNILIPFATAVLLVVYFLQNIWVFDMVSSYVMFFLSLAFVNFLISSQNKKDEEDVNQRVVPLPSFVGGLLIILTIFTFYFGNIQPARASRFILKGVAFPLEQSIPAFQNAFETSPMVKFEAPEQASVRVSKLMFEPEQDKELLNRGFELAEEKLKNSINQGPLDFRYYLSLGRHYNNFYQFSGNQEKLVLAEEVLKKAAGLSPSNQQAYWALSQTRLFQGNLNEALSLAEKAVDLEPRLADSHLIVIQIAKIMGDDELVKKKAEEAIKVDPSWEPRIKEILGTKPRP